MELKIYKKLKQKKTDYIIENCINNKYIEFVNKKYNKNNNKKTH